MDDITFNKSFFPRYNDELFKTAVYFTKNSKISLAIQEFLFFARQDGILRDKTSLLSFVEVFNETQDYVNNWFLGLDILNSEADWWYHKNKLITRFKLFQEVNIDEIEKFYANFKAQYPNEVILIRNSAIIWGNTLYKIDSYSYEKNEDGNKNKWILWKNLVNYRIKDLDRIQGYPELITDFKKMIKNRSTDSDYSQSYANLNDKDSLNKIEEIVGDFEIILLNRNIKNKVPLLETVKKKLKI